MAQVGADELDVEIVAFAIRAVPDESDLTSRQERRPEICTSPAAEVMGTVREELALVGAWMRGTR